MKCIDILLKFNTINIGCNTHEAVGVVLTRISYVQKTPMYVCTHMRLYILYNTTSLFLLSATSWSGGFDAWPLLVIVVTGTDGLAITSGD